MLSRQLKNEALFILHGALSVGAYFVPFIITWKIAVPLFVGVALQHAIFGRCLMNARHGLSENDGSTYYSEAIERMGFHPNKKSVRFFVRKILYPFLTVVTLCWQLLLGNQPLWF